MCVCVGGGDTGSYCFGFVRHHEGQILPIQSARKCIGRPTSRNGTDIDMYLFVYVVVLAKVRCLIRRTVCCVSI